MHNICLHRHHIRGDVSDPMVRVMTTTSVKRSKKSAGGITHDHVQDNIQRTLGYTFKESNNTICLLAQSTLILVVKEGSLHVRPMCGMQMYVYET